MMSEKSDRIFQQAVALRIKGLCAERQITIRALAAASGVSPSTIYGIFNPARKNVRVETILKLCNGLGISMKEFFHTEMMNVLEQEVEKKRRAHKQI